MPIHEEEVNFHCFSNSFKIFFFLELTREEKKLIEFGFFGVVVVVFIGLVCWIFLSARGQFTVIFRHCWDLR